MSRIYDSWEKLVGDVLRREEDRQLALRESFSSSSSADLTSRSSFSFNPFAVDIHVPPEVCRNFCRNVVAIEYKEIKKATRNFRTTAMIGEALFTPVFKGWIDEDDLTAKKPGCGIAISVYIIDLERFQGYEGWVVDGINCWSRLLHPNLVKLIGCSFDTHNRILVVHEFMVKRSLDDLLLRGPGLLPWATRITVAVGAARALSFLHDMEIPVMHRNVMSSNILLDGDFNTKLLYFDFDLFRDGPQVMCGHGYDAPEYIATASTIRSDVHGFGVCLLELISGLRVVDRNRPRGMHNLIDWARPYLKDKKSVSKIVDSRLMGEYPYKEACKVAKIALQCVSEDPRLRPRMSEVVAELEKL